MDYRPILKRQRVEPQKLILDPNNPRFLTKSEDRTEETDYLDPGVQELTLDRIRSDDDEYRINALKNSIRSNGWQPVDAIFVRAHGPKGYYIVLEGNRRVTAVRDLIRDETVAPELKRSLKWLWVMEIVDDAPSEEVAAKVNYLLGVRHHGSLKQWSPFAQAHNMHARYLSVVGLDEDSFEWDMDAAESIAETLSVETKVVEERLRVYRVLSQLDSLPGVKKIGGISGRYYSVCRELLLKKRGSKLHDYISQDHRTFALDEEGLARIDRLCHFSTKGRKGAPINNPAEWRPFEKILADPDDEERARMVQEVEEDKEKPSEVYARRAAQLRKPRWDTWLEEVRALLGRLTIAEIEATPEAKSVGNRLASLLSALSA